MAATLDFIFDLTSEAASQLSLDKLVSSIVLGTGSLLGVYDSTKTYTKNDKTIYVDSDGIVHIFICTVQSTTGTIDLTAWDDYSVLDELEEVKNEYTYIATTQPTTRLNKIWIQKASTDSAGIIHGTYSYNLEYATNVANNYAQVYLKNGIEDVSIKKFTVISNLDAIPAIDYTTNTLQDLVENFDASIRKLTRDKYDASNVTTTATANKVLTLNADAQLPAVATHAVADKNGVDLTTYLQSISLVGTTLSFKKGDGSTGTFTTQDNNNAVLNTLSTTTKAYVTGTTTAITNTGTQVFDTGVYLGATVGSLYATTFYGALSGNAATATSDANGNNISTTYATKLENNLKANAADLSTVATSGSYTDLTNKPYIPTKTSDLTNDSNYLTTASSLAAANISGIIDLSHLPASAVERQITVDTLAAMYALTIDQVQNGDVVQVGEAGPMYRVIDDTQLSVAAGYREFSAGLAASVPWSGITGKPDTYTPSDHTQAASTITGLATVATSGLYADLLNKPYIPTKTSDLTNNSDFVTSTGTIANATLAATATKALQDTNGNKIIDTYETKANAITGLSTSGTTVTITKGDGTTSTITTKDTTYNAFAGASDTTDGGTGLVPAPTSANYTYYLRGDGTWAIPTNTTYTAGTGLVLSGTTFNHSNSVTAGTASGGSGTVAFGGTISIPSITYDAQGHVTAKGSTTVTLPANPNTDTLMTQTVSTTNSAYPILLSSATTTGTRTAVFGTGITVNPSTKTITASIFSGSLSGTATSANTLFTARTIGLSGVTATAQSFNGSADITIPITAVPASLITGSLTNDTSGNAATATKATQDALGNVITDTYEKKTNAITGLSASGTTITITKGDTTTSTINTQDTTYTDFTGATATAAGTNGLVPAPASGSNAFFLRGDGKWAEVVTTDNYVTNTLNNSVKAYITGTTTATTNTGSQVFDNAVYLGATPGTLYATTFYGTLSGAATSADQATKDSVGNNISTTYATKTENALKANTADLAAVATSGSYTDLSNTPTKVSTFTNDSGYLTAASSLNADKITGVIDLSHIPSGALERQVDVDTLTAMYALTTDQVQNGDVVKVGTGNTAVMYRVVDQTQLSTAAGYSEFTSGIATKAVADQNGDTIDTTYLKLAGGTMTGALALGGNNISGAGTITGATLHATTSVTSDSTISAPTITATTGFTGNLTGTATNATKDASGNVITSTYETKANAITGLTVSGTVITYTKGDGSSGTITTQDTNNLVTNTLNAAVKAYITGTTTATTNTGSQVFDTGVYLGDTAGSLHATTFYGALSGNASTASTLATARTIGLSGVTATAQSFNGSAAITIPVTAVPASLITGTLTNDTSGNASTATQAAEDGNGQEIIATYIKGLTVSGQVITYTKGDDTTGTITTQDTNTTYSDMTGATASAAGSHGLVPAPDAGNNTKFLRGDGTWVIPTDTNTTYTAGTGLALSGTTFNHSNSVTAGTASGSSGSVSYGGTITIPSITYDAQGHITGKSSTNVTLPASDNTDVSMTQTVSTTSSDYPVLLSSATTTGTRGGIFGTGVTINPSTNNVKATTFTGALSGNATTATTAGTTTGNAGTATTLQTARTIGLSGVTATDQSFNGSANITIPITAVPSTLITGTLSNSTTGNAATATKATQDGNNQEIIATYIKDLSINGQVITYTKGNDTTGTITLADSVDTNMTQTASTTAAEYPILLSSDTANGTRTGLFGTGVTVNPSTNAITATSFIGTATKATGDASGNNIAATYSTKATTVSSMSVSGRTITLTKADNSTATVTTAYALYSEVWNASGQLVSPAGWIFYITN